MLFVVRLLMRMVVSWQNVDNLRMLTSTSDAIIKCKLSTPLCTDRLTQHATMHIQMMMLMNNW